jgi:Bardet-Biedl syndrome 5 protein
MHLWQDREIRFDIPLSEATERQGEETLATFDPVEDTKGNNGVRGLIRITNLRVVWETKKHDNLNLSIGLKTIINCSQKTVASKLRGNVEALHVLAKGLSSRFEVQRKLVVNSSCFYTTCTIICTSHFVQMRVQAV